MRNQAGPVAIIGSRRKVELISFLDCAEPDFSKYRHLYVSHNSAPSMHFTVQNSIDERAKKKNTKSWGSKTKTNNPCRYRTKHRLGQNQKSMTQTKSTIYTSSACRLNHSFRHLSQILILSMNPNRLFKSTYLLPFLSRYMSVTATSSEKTC